MIDFITSDNKNGLEAADLDKYILKTNSYGFDLYKLEIPEKLTKYYIKNNSTIFTLNSEVIESTYITPDSEQTFNQMVQSFQFID